MKSMMLRLIRTNAAVVCVQIDVSRKLPDRVWVGVGAGGFWQPIFYPDPPLFCSTCSWLGHSNTNCRQGNMDKREQVAQGTQQEFVKPPIIAKTPTWRPIKLGRKADPQTSQQEKDHLNVQVNDTTVIAHPLQGTTTTEPNIKVQYINGSPPTKDSYDLLWMDDGKTNTHNKPTEQEVIAHVLQSSPNQVIIALFLFPFLLK